MSYDGAWQKRGSHYIMVLELLLTYLLHYQLTLRYYLIIAQSVRLRLTVTKIGRKSTKYLALKIMREHLGQWRLNVP